MKNAFDPKGTIFENAKVVRAVQYTGDGKKTEENLVYTIELELNKTPLIVTLRVGTQFTELSVIDKKTGKLMEYLSEQGGKVEFVKSHQLNNEQIKRMLSKES